MTDVGVPSVTLKIVPLPLVPPPPVTPYKVLPTRIRFPDRVPPPPVGVGVPNDANTLGVPPVIGSEYTVPVPLIPPELVVPYSVSPPTTISPEAGTVTALPASKFVSIVGVPPVVGTENTPPDVTLNPEVTPYKLFPDKVNPE